MANIIPRSSLFGNVARINPFMDIDDWMNDFGIRPALREMAASPQIKIDLTENDKSYFVRAEIPGVSKEDIKVEVDGNMVSISAEVKRNTEKKEGEKLICSECYQGSSYRSFSLGGNVDEANTQAKYKDGILELTLPKKNGISHKQIAIS